MRALRLAVVLLHLPLEAWARAPIGGFTFPTWWKDGYASAPAGESLKLLAQTGAGWVALVPTWLMDSAHADSIAPTDATASDESLRGAIRAAKTLGLKVLLKPHVDIPYGPPRAAISAKKPARWFEHYRRMNLQYARLAKDEGVDMYCVGTELFGMTAPAYGKYWKQVIAEARAAYPGPLVYAANWYGVARVSFWEDLDYIGVDGYFPLAGGSDKELLKASWKAYLPLLRAASRASGKPVIFTEVGLSSQKGAALRPWDYGNFGPVDLAEQTAYFEAFLETFDAEPYFAGFFQWAWELDAKKGGPDDGSMTVQGKPALKSLEAWFKRAPAAPTVEPRPALQESARRLTGFLRSHDLLP